MLGQFCLAPTLHTDRADLTELGKGLQLIKRSRGMWDTQADTPPASPSTQTAEEVIHTEGPKKATARSSSYYADVLKRRKEVCTSIEEQQYGWGDLSRLPSQSRLASIVKAHRTNAENQGGGSSRLDQDFTRLGIHELIDPLDYAPRVSRSSRTVQRQRSKSRLRWPRTCINSSAFDDKHMDMAPPLPEKSEIHLRQMEAARAARDHFLKRRYARGSIMYSAETGVARIPLYNAPHAAGLGAAAPALSSFAPRAPLTVKGSVDPTSDIPIATAAATVAPDGQVVDIIRQKGFKRTGSRYSAFVRAGATPTPTPKNTLPGSPLALLQLSTSE